MSEYHSIRSRVIRIIFGVAFLIIIAQLANLQLFSSKYGIEATNQSIYRKIVYPSRGLVYDRKGKVILDNTTLYDLVVTPSQLKGVDTLTVCNILGIDTVEFKRRIISLAFKNGKYQPSVFQGLLDNRTYNMLNENLYKLSPGFDLIARPIRKYPFDAAGPVLGYLGEVDTGYLRRHPEGGYMSGDYMGISGLERSYEKALMGQRGIEYWQRDNKNRPTSRYQNSKHDTAAVAGSNLHTSIDVDLQALGEKLMHNKLGSIVAIDPKTGGILALVSGPEYDPELLTGAARRKNFSQLLNDPRKPLLNRAVSATYSPGSTFKTLQALIGLQEGVIDTRFQVSCSGAFYGCGYGKPMKCLDYGTFSLRSAITKSDNTYFATVMQKVINNPKFPSIDSSLNTWANYMRAFGMGHKLGADIPAEKSGLLPDADYYNKIHGKGKWNYCSFRSVSIGQGEVNVTPLQVANEMAYLANKGWYITPHVVDSIDGGDKFGLLSKYKEKHRAVEIGDSVFEAVHDGMQGVVSPGGTGAVAMIKGITICGKTGTVENYRHGKKEKNHSFFAAFAPREDPKIAIMCVVENSGFGATYAAPIVSLMIEKYLKDSIQDRGRLAKIEQLNKTSLIPSFIYADFRHQDSLYHAKDSAYLLQKGYIKMMKDTLDLEDDVEIDTIPEIKKPIAPIKPEKKKNKPDSSQNSPAILPKPDDKKPSDNNQKDTTQ